MLISLYRVLITTIHDKGSCPCPHASFLNSIFLVSAQHQTQSYALSSSALTPHNIRKNLFKHVTSFTTKAIQWTARTLTTCSRRDPMYRQRRDAISPLRLLANKLIDFSEHVFVTIGQSRWWFQFFHSIGCWSAAWAWAGSLESIAYSPDMNSTHPRWRHSDGVPHHSVQIYDSNIDNMKKLYRLWHPSGCPADDT